MADCKKEKRRLSDMDADEFMLHGLDSDLSEDEDMDEGSKQSSAPTSSTKKPSKKAAHKDQIARLQEKDPEFFKFLQENDQKLLKFGDSDEDMEEESEDDDDDDDDEKGGSEGSDDEKMDEKEVTNAKKKKKVADEDDHDDNAEDAPSPKKGKLVTMEMIKKWKQGLEKMSLQSLRQVMKAFRSAVHGALDDILDAEAKSKSSRQHLFKVEGNAVFNAIIQLCLKHVPTLVQHHVGEATRKHGKVHLPSSHKNWPQVKNQLKFYLSDLMQLLRTLAEPSMLCVMLKHTQQMSSYYACYPKLTRMLIKRLVRMWGTGDDNVRVVAFLGISKLISLLPSTLLEFSLKQLYMGFVKNTKFMSPKMRPLITFMQNSLVEVFKVDPQMTYQHAFMYIRQMAIHLRNAILNKKKDSHQSVYNWQFIHCLHLWCRVLSEASCQSVLQPLIYPLVQVILGAIKLLPTSRYYPLRFHCVRSLNMLSSATNTYVPTAPFLIEILESPEFNKRVKMSTAKPTEFSCILKVSKSQLSTKPFEDAVLDNIFELLLEFFAIHGHSIAFPEIVLPTVIQLRKYIKMTKVAKFRKQMKQLLDKIEETSKEVTDRRSSVTFSPKDLVEVERWTSQYTQHPNTIVKFHNTWKAMKPIISPEPQEEDFDPNDSDSEEEQRKPKPRSSKKTDQKPPRKQNERQEETKSKETNTNGHDLHDDKDIDAMEDIVEDFEFSSDDDN